MRSDSVKVSDQIFNANDSEFSKGLFNNFIGSNGDSLLVDLSETSLVDQSGDGVSGGESESDKRFDLLDHVKGGSVNSDQSSVVDLSESQQLKDLSDIGSQIVNTSDSGDKDELGFSGNIESTFSSSLSLKIDDLLLFSFVSLVVGFSSLGVFSSLGLGLFLSLGNPSLSGFTELGVSGSLLEVSLGDVGLRFFDLH